MAIIPTSSPPRSIAPLRRESGTWTSLIADPNSIEARQWPIENPWISPEIIGEGNHCDERHWLTMERDPAISGAMEARISMLLGGGLRLEPGSGPGASELFDFWTFVLGEHPLTAISCYALRSMFRGWECFEQVGAWRQWEGRRVFVPVALRDSNTWDFRWTATRDLIHCPSGVGFDGTIYLTSRLLPARMKWWTPRSGISNPYGDPLHGKYLVLDYAFRQLSEAGLIQIRQAQGFLRAKHNIPINTDEAVAQVNALEAKVLDIVGKMQTSGVLIQPAGWEVDWVSLTSSISGWIELFQYFGGEARSFYAGANLPTQMIGASGSRSAAEVQERSAMRLGQVDAAKIAYQFREGFMRPWSAWNAATISPELSHQFNVPRLDDVPLSSVPELTFVGLERMTAEDLEFLKIISEIGVVDSESIESEGEGDSMPQARPDVRSILQQRHVPLLNDDEVGPTLDLSKAIPPPSPFGPIGEQDVERAAGAELDENEGEADDGPAPGERGE